MCGGNTMVLGDAQRHELYMRRIRQSYLSLHGYASHHVESFEHFIHFSLREIVFEQHQIDINCPKQKTLHRIEFDDMTIQKPTIKESTGFINELTPTEAILRKQTYSADVFVDITHKEYKVQKPSNTYKLVSHRVYKNVLYFNLPCMRNSTMCHDHEQLDAVNRDRGTFIINGYEKIMVTQEKLKTNFPYVFTIKNPSKFTHRCQVRSYHASKIRSTSTLNIFITAEKSVSAAEIFVVVPFIKTNIPLSVVFRLLGVNDTKRMICYITGTTPPVSAKFLYTIQSIMCHDTSNTVDMDADDLYDYIGLGGCVEKQKAKRIQYIKHIFVNEFLPHCGNSSETSEGSECDTNTQKAFYLGYAIRKLLMVKLGEKRQDDIDSYVHKRACTAGSQFALLTRQLVRNFIKMIRVQIFKNVNSGKYINIIDYFNHRKISAGLKYGCATGNWGIQKGANNQTGVCQVLNTMNLAARYSHMRLINTPLNRDGKQPHPRQLKDSHYGIFCAAETPEGKAVGLLNVLGTLTRVRVGYQSQYIISILYADMGVTPLADCTTMQSTTVILVNGVICGCVDKPSELVELYKQYRQYHDVPIDTSILYRKHTEEISIQADSGDCYVPLIVVRNMHKLVDIYSLYCEYLHLLWNQLLIEGVIEYVSKEEQESIYVADSFQALQNDIDHTFTHMEIQVADTIFGVSAGIIPFANHNQGNYLLFFFPSLFF